MKPVAIFRHLECEGPGYFAEFLARNNIPHELIRIDQNDNVPESIEAHSALVFMGGPMSVNDELPWIKQELTLIRQAAREKMPVLGHCLGGQLICKALGGKVTANPVKEIGWHNVQCLQNTESEKWLANLPEEFVAFHWHGETFSIPEGATAILKSELCDHQAFTMDNILALQCHVEMTAEMVTEWAREYAHELEIQSPGVQSAESMNRDLEQNVRELNSVADQLYSRWLIALKG